MWAKNCVARSALWNRRPQLAEEFLGPMKTRRSRVRSRPVLSRFRTGSGFGLGLGSRVGVGPRPHLDPSREQNAGTAYQRKDPSSQVVIGAHSDGRCTLSEGKLSDMVCG